MQTQCKQEIGELHKFFVDWFRGEIESTEENFTRVSNVLADEFILITPRGEQYTREQMLPMLREAHGSRQDEKPPFRIWIENFQLRFTTRKIALATYEEWQDVAGETTSRLSTALFRRKADADGLEWLHVHETWLEH